MRGWRWFDSLRSLTMSSPQGNHDNLFRSAQAVLEAGELARCHLRYIEEHDARLKVGRVLGGRGAPPRVAIDLDFAGHVFRPDPYSERSEERRVGKECR